MYKWINFDRQCTDFSRKISRNNKSIFATAEAQNVQGKNWKKSLNKTKIILFNIFFFLFVCLRCINWVIRFPNTVTYWLVWLYTTSERQILFFSFDYRNYLQCVSMMLRGAWTLNEPFKLPKVFRYLQVEWIR